MSKEQISIKNLAVVDIPNGGQIEIDNWKWRDQHFFPAEQCARQLLIGHIDDLPNVPSVISAAATSNLETGIDSGIKILTGEDAYRHLIMVACGMKDEQFGEKQTITDMRENWNKFLGTGKFQGKVGVEKKAMLEQTFARLVNAVFADASTVRDLAFSPGHEEALKPVSVLPAVTARSLLKLQSEDTVAVYAGTENFTMKNLKGLDHKARRIIITHADGEQLEKLRRNIEALKGEGGLKATYEFVPASEMKDRLPGVKAVIDMVPLGNETRDTKMMEKWRTANPPLPPLVHLRGSPSHKEKTNPEWLAAAIPGVFHVEDLEAQRQRDEQHNNQVTAKLALHLIGNCIQSRLAGKQPVKAQLTRPAEEYAAFIAGASAGAPTQAGGPMAQGLRPKTGGWAQAQGGEGA